MQDKRMGSFTCCFSHCLNYDKFLVKNDSGKSGLQSFFSLTFLQIQMYRHRHIMHELLEHKDWVLLTKYFAGEYIETVVYTTYYVPNYGYASSQEENM